MGWLDWTSSARSAWTAKPWGMSVVLSRAGALMGLSSGYGIPRRAAGVTCASHGFVLRDSPHGLLLLAPQHTRTS